MESIEGFSKLSRNEKIAWLSRVVGDDTARELLSSFWHSDRNRQKSFEEFSENTVSNFFLPFGVAPNFIINGKTYAVPMVIEESSVVAAAAAAAKFWSTRGGINAKVLKTVKVGQVHFFWQGPPPILRELFHRWKPSLTEEMGLLTESMRRRGGGLLSLQLLDKTRELPGYYQLFGEFETCDAMGGNFINSVLEFLGRRWAERVDGVEVIMCILSNYTPDCLVHAQVSCPIAEMDDFARKFKNAVDIAQVDPYRATTHNKGIFNGVDAVVIATGNDYRAIEACGHTYASRDGQYRGLTRCHLENDYFIFSIDLPLALGTVGGLTSLHPLAEFSLKLLQYPSVKELMMVAASVGLMQNFAALRSLVTTGIQRGHMKMHLLNILKMLDADEWEQEQVKEYFADRVISFAEVKGHLSSLREKPTSASY